MVHTSFLCFDTETTDLVNNRLLPLDKQPHIIEFAAIRMDEVQGVWTETKALEMLIKPPVAVTDEIAKITNIDRDELAKAFYFKEYQDEIVKFFDGVKFRFGHNITFDEAMLDFEFARLGLGPVWRFPRQKSRCTVELNEHVFGRRAKMDEVYAHYMGKPLIGAHRAMTDVRGNVEIVLKMIETGAL